MPIAEDINIFCSQNRVSHGTSAVRELGLILDVFAHVIRCGCCLSGENFLKLLELGMSMGFVCPDMVLQFIADHGTIKQAMSQLTFKWATLITAAFDCRVAMSSPGEHVLFKMLSQAESFDLNGENFVTRIVIPLTTACSSRAETAISSVSRNHMELHSRCAEYILYIISVLLHVTMVRVQLHETSDLSLHKYAEWARSTYDIIPLKSIRSNSMIFLTDVCLAQQKKSVSINSFFRDAISRSECNAGDQNSNDSNIIDTTETFDSVSEMTSALQCSVFQEVVDFILLDIFWDTDAGGVLEIDTKVLSLIRQFYYNLPNLCRPFWKQWAIYRAASVEDIKLLIYEPYSPLCRLIMELSRTVEAPNLFVHVISSLLCDEESCRECFGFLAQPIVLRSWVHADDLDRVDRSDQTEDSLVILRRLSQNLGCLVDIIGRPFTGAYGKIVALHDDKLIGTSYLVRWEDNCYSSWWGICFKILASDEAGDSLMMFDELVETKASVKDLIAISLRFEGMSSIFEHLESHWSDLCTLHMLNQVGASRDANGYLSLLRHHGITPATLKAENVSDLNAADVIHQCSGLSIEQAMGLVVSLRIQFKPLRDLMLSWCLDQNYASHTHIRLVSSLGLLHSLMRSHNFHLVHSDFIPKSLNAMLKVSVATGCTIERQLFPDLVASVCEKLISADTLELRYHAVTAFGAFIPYLLAPDRFNILGQIFLSLDRNRSGKITLLDFREALPEIMNTTEFPALVLSRVFFKNKSELDYSQFFEACLVLKNGLPPAPWLAELTPVDKYFTEYITNCIQQPLNSALPEGLAIEALTSMLQFCIRTLLLCDPLKKRNCSGFYVMDENHAILSQLQVCCFKMLHQITSCNRNASKNAIILKEWLVDSFVSDSLFQGALLRTSLELGINSVLVSALRQQDSQEHSNVRVPKLVNFKSLKDLVYGADVSLTKSTESKERFLKEESLLPLDFSYQLPHLACVLSSSPILNCSDIDSLESLSVLSLQLLSSLIDNLDSGHSAGCFAAVLNAFNTARVYQSAITGHSRGEATFFASDGRLTFSATPIGSKDNSSSVNVSYSGLLCGLLGYRSFARKRGRVLLHNDDDPTISNVSGLAAVLLIKLLRGEIMMRTTHAGISYSNRMLDCIGATNVAALTSCISLILEVQPIRDEKYVEAIELKIEVLNLLALLAKNDQMSLGHLLLVTGEVATVSAMPPRPGQALGAGVKSCQTRSLLSSALLSLLAQLEGIASFRKSASDLELGLLDITLAYLISCWESCRTGSSAVVAAHVISLTESSVFWAVVTAPLLKDLDAVPELFDNKVLSNVKSLYRQDVSCYCHKISILASCFSFLSMERFGQIYGIEDTALRYTSIIGVKDRDDNAEFVIKPAVDMSSHHAGNFSRAKVDEFFRRCADQQRFLYWTKTYPNLFIKMEYESIAQHCALNVGISLDYFRRLLHVDTDYFSKDVGSDYIYSLSALMRAASAHGWNQNTISHPRNASWNNMLISLSNVNCMWSIADAQSILLQKFRHFLEITVFPPESGDMSNLSRSLSITSRRSPSFEQSGSPKKDNGTTSPTSTYSNSPKVGKTKICASVLSPRGSSHFALPPSPSVLLGESSFIGDKRSYHLLVELLRQVAFGDDFMGSFTVGDGYLDCSTSELRSKFYERAKPNIPELDNISVLVVCEKIAIVTTMLHHQLKDICVRTVDPSLAKTKFRDTSSTRLTKSKIVELLELVCTAYRRIICSLVNVLCTGSDCSAWNVACSDLILNFLTCMQLLIVAVNRSPSDIDSSAQSDHFAREVKAKVTTFQLIFDTILKNIALSPENKSLLADSPSAESGKRSCIGSSGHDICDSNRISGESLRPSVLLRGNSALQNFGFSDLCTQKKMIIVKIALNVLCSTIPVKRQSLVAINDQGDQWHIGFDPCGEQIQFIITLLTDLSTYSIPNVERECDYTRWQDFSDIQRSLSMKEAKDLAARAASDTQSIYAQDGNDRSCWVCLNSTLDILIKLVKTPMLRPTDTSVWNILTFLNNSPLFIKFQEVLKAQRQSEKNTALLMAYSARSGEESAVCCAWIRCLRLVASVLVSQGNTSSLNNEGSVANVLQSTSRPLSITQLLCIFMDKYKYLLLLPFVDINHRLSIGQLKLLESTMSVFNAYDLWLPLWKCISNLHLVIRQRVISAVCLIVTVLGDGTRLTHITENVKKYFLFLSDQETIAADPLECTVDSRPSSPREDERLGRSQSFDSFSETFTTPRTKKHERNSASKKTHSAIAVMLQILVPMLSHLRHVLPSPFIGDAENKKDRKCFNGGSILVPSVLVAGTSVVYRTKREFLLSDKLKSLQDPLSKPPAAGQSVVDYDLEIGVIIEMRTIMDTLYDDCMNTYDGTERQVTLYTMLLRDGTVEDGVPTESIVSASAPIIPFLTRRDFHCKLTQKSSSCTSSHMIQVVLLIFP